MLKRHKALLAAVVAAASAVTSVTAASASPGGRAVASATEYVQVMSASTASGPASAIAYGAFTAAGEAYLGNARLGKVAFPGGTIVLSHKASKSASQFNLKTCLSIISQAGTYTIVSGTGTYARIKGSGKYQLSLEFIDRRSANGKCSSTEAPAAQQKLLRLYGPVRL
jgi:hypothetical protein